MIRALPEPGEQRALDVYNLAAARLVGGAQRRSAQIAIAYLAALRAPVRQASLERALEGVRVTRESPVARSPILRLWKLLDEGQEHAAAVIAAGTYASALCSGDLQAAQRGGLQEGAAASGARVQGWVKELSPTACEWCQTIGVDQVYRSPDGVPFHANDTCSASPVFEGEE